MVMRFFQANIKVSSAQSASCDSPIWRTSWASVLIVSCSLLNGCQSTRLGTRPDSLSSKQSEDQEDIESKPSNKSLSSFFSRWWLSDPKDDTYDLGLPRVEEDYVGSVADATDRTGRKQSSEKASGGKGSPANPAERRTNQFAKKDSPSDLEESDGLNDQQRDLHRRQLEAIRRMELSQQDLNAILADDSAQDDALNGIVQLPPITKPKASAEQAAANSAVGSEGARLKFSDDSTPPPPPSLQSQLPVAPPLPQQVAIASPAALPPTTLPSAPSLAVNTLSGTNPTAPAGTIPATGFPVPTNPVPTNPIQGNLTTASQGNPNATPAKDPRPLAFQPLQPASPVQPASTTSGTDQTNAIMTGPYLESNSQNSPPTHWENDVRQAVVKLQERLKQDKTLTPKERTNLEARLRLIQLAANDMDAAMNPNQGWNKDADQWFRSTLFSIHEATALTGPESPNQRFSLVAKHQQEATQHLLSLSDLEINNVTFCTEVQSYGQVVKRPANALTANEEVILYCEFNNFAALKVHDGYETEFEARYEIVDLQNNRIYEEKLPTDRQTSANRRRDYFIAYQMYLPKDIAPGHYRLKLNVKDVKAGKFGQGLVEFQIVK